MTCQCGARVATVYGTNITLDWDPVEGGDILFVDGKPFRLREPDPFKARFVEHRCKGAS